MPSFQPDTLDTIVAIITPPGEGGIAVLRLSGEAAINHVDAVFHGKQKLSEAASHTAHLGDLVDERGNLVDEVLVTIFRSPHSYTMENVVEIGCHGSAFIAQKILTCFIHRGVRPAEPGEFTKRAFLNGRIDLSQAEAVAELIHSRSDSAHRASLRQLQGLHSNKFQELRQAILDLCSLLELELDFSEEGISLIETSTSESKLIGLLRELSQLIDSYRLGKIYREGIKVVLAGRPNVGKSSLLNALLNENRSIVTNISGTTRDTIEEFVRLATCSIRGVDTAGLRSTDDRVESEGVKRAEAEIEDGDIVAYVIDASLEILDEDFENIRKIRANVENSKRSFLLVANKIDLVGKPFSASGIGGGTGLLAVEISATTGEGIAEFKRVLSEICFSGTPDIGEKSVIVTNARHQAKLIQARDSLEKALSSLREQQSNEFVAMDLRAALRHIGEITGSATSEDVLNNIFANFCIGK